MTQRRHTRLGRNDPCPCGSGRKYKRCHLGKEPSGTYGVVDDTSRRLLELAITDHSRFLREVRAPADELSRTFVAEFGPLLKGREAAEALQIYLEKIEERMAIIARRRSRFFWMHVSRRIPPVPLHDSSTWTALLARTVFELALLKHGCSTDEEDMRITELDSIVPSRLTYEDARDIYSLESLAYEYNHAATSYRRVGKGAILVADNECDYSTDASTKLERRMQLLDRRAERYQDMFSYYGTALDTSVQPNTASEAPLWLLAVPILNVYQYDFPEKASAELRFFSTKTTNYLAHFLAVRPILAYLTIFAQQIEESLGVSPARLLAFLSAICLRQWTLMKQGPQEAIQFFQRGYRVTPAAIRERTLSEVAFMYAGALKVQAGIDLDNDAALIDVNRIVDSLTYGTDDYAAISLWDRAPSKLILVHGDYTVWDYAAIPSFLRALAGEVGFLVGEPANHKSAAFERHVNQLIALTDGVTPWQTGVLRSKDGRSRELDASFVTGDVLYLVECKAFSANPRIDRGDYAALRSRWETLDNYMTQVKTLAEFIEKNPIGRNYLVPDTVAHIEYCVCTPLAEHIQSSDNDYWFDEETPRVCVPQELLEYATFKKSKLLIDES